MDVVHSELAHRDPACTGILTTEKFQSFLSIFCPEISHELVGALARMFVDKQNGFVEYEHFMQILNPSSLTSAYQTGNDLNRLLQHKDQLLCLSAQLPALVSPHPQHGLPGARILLQKKVG